MKLTRKQVLTESKASDLESVRKLNCWGCKLSDISILSQMPNLQVLSLSVNSISSLSPLAGCLSLCELYLRRNMIASLSELCYLRPMTRLRILWLTGNPCCGDGSSQYRLAVLRCLPRLRRLDNRVVTEDEITLAHLEGEEIGTPPNPAQHQPPSNGLFHAEKENDSLAQKMEETNNNSEEFTSKPLSRDKFTSFPSQSTGPSMKKSHTLDAVLLLLRDLDHEELRVVHIEAQNRLRTCTLNSETLGDSQSSKSADIQH
ncbi:cilia and flagella associated protein 410 [Syngnathoides biaculeatus]|uniref:cilia and flagella associated protein 410 n=1 Tax=Syngnathoides biaculeatus TaxID=300417 RepID=UPI002ADE2D1C|nr:cilia and flagella associated protein 410 [Syngnathoides biaculeatus]